MVAHEANLFFLIFFHSLPVISKEAVSEHMYKSCFSSKQMFQQRVPTPHFIYIIMRKSQVNIYDLYYDKLPDLLFTDTCFTTHASRA